MADIHIEEFYKDAALILLHLYANFPRKASVFVEDIAGPDTPDEYGLHSARHESCFGCMLWLAEEDFIRYADTIRREAIDQAILTQKAFTKLASLCKQDSLKSQAMQFSNQIPASPDQLTHIYLIRHTIKRGTSTQLSQVMESVLFS